MDQHDDHDPFAGLEEWARDTERRVRRERRTRGLRRHLLLLCGFAVVAVLLAAAVPAVRALLPTAASGADGTASPAPSVPGVAPSVPAVAPSVPGVAPGGPFAGTPAAGYPEGPAGITLPAAKAVTGFTAAQVDAALQRVRAALVAGRLAQPMLVGHDPAGLLTLLAKNQRGTVARMFRTTTFDTVATWIDPAVRLDPAAPPRVTGRVTYTSKQRDGIRTLQVTTNFVWVYAFAGPDHPLAVAHDEIHWEFPSTERLRTGDRGMWIGDTKAYTAWVDCAAAARGLLAPTRSGAAAPAGTEDQNAYLRPDHSLDITDECPS